MKHMRSKTRRRTLLLAVPGAAVLALLQFPVALATPDTATFPNKPVHIIVVVAPVDTTEMLMHTNDIQSML